MSYNFINEISRAVIDCINGGLSSEYAKTNDPVIKKVLDNKNVHLNWPIEKEEFPGYWVSITFGSPSLYGIEPYIKTERKLRAKTDITVNVTSVGRTILENNALIVAFFNMFVFASLAPETSDFLKKNYNDNLTALNIDTSSLSGLRDQVSMAPYDDKSQLYSSSFSFTAWSEWVSSEDTRELSTIESIEIIPNSK